MKRLRPAPPYAYPRFFLVMALVAPVQEWSVIGAWSLHPKRPLFPFALSVGMQWQRGLLEPLILRADDSSDPRRYLAERLITCQVPCDHIPRRSWALFRARDVMRGVIESFQTEHRT